MASIAVFVPPYLIVIAGAPYYRRFAKKLASEGVQGVTAAAVGAITGAAFILGRRSLIDLQSLNCSDDFRTAQFQENPGTILDSWGRNGWSAAFQRVGPYFRCVRCSGPIFKKRLTNCLHSPAAP
jgi:hypothetical protein